MENNQEESILHMHLDYDGGNILKETVRWSRFLSIVGIVGISLGAFVFALMGTALIAVFSRLVPGLETFGEVGGTLIIVTMLVVFAISGYVVYMLYRFSVLTRRGIQQQDPAVFAEGMKCLKIYFVVSGIFAILGLLINLLSITKLFHS
jgi:hypothetical protein